MDWMISEVSSNLDDSVIQDSFQHPHKAAPAPVRCRGRAKNLSVNFSCGYGSERSSLSVLLPSQPTRLLQNPVSDWRSTDAKRLRTSQTPKLTQISV